MSRLAKAARAVFPQQSVPLRDLPVPAGGSPWQQWGWNWQQPLHGERDYMRDVGDGSDNNAIQAVVQFIANQMMEAPVQVLLESDYSEIKRHPMTETIKRPNPYYSGSLLWLATRVDKLLDGNGYWLKRRAESGGVAEYWWAPHWTMMPKGSEDGRIFITHYEYTPGGANSMIKLDPSEVVHFRWGLDPKNPRLGYSPVKGLLREIYSDEEAARWVAATLRTGGAPSVVLAPKGESGLTPAEAADVKADLIQKTTGDNRGAPLVMLSPTELMQYGFSPQQMDLTAVRSIPESRIASAFGIPAAVVGFLTGMKQTQVGATLSELRQLAYESGIVPKLVLDADELSTQVLPDFTSTPDNFVVRFDLSQVRVLQEDENARSTRLLAQLEATAISVEEVRAEFGREPQFTAGDHLLVKSANDVVPVDQLDAIQPAPPQQLPVPPRIAARRVMMARPSAQQVAFLRAMDRAHQRDFTLFADDLQRQFADLGESAATAYERTGTRLVADPVDDALVATLIAQLGIDAWTAANLVPLFGRQYQRIALSTYQAMGQTFELGVGTDLPDPIAREVVALGGKRVGLIDLTAQTRQALFDALSQARADGLGPVEAAKTIRQYVGAGRYTAMEAAKPGAGIRYRAETIARTETLYAQNVSVHEAGKAAGFTKWLAFDNRTGFDDEECVPAGTRIAALDPELGFTRWFEGDLIEIETADGGLLAATKNHPILTPHGWIAAGKIQEGDQVVRSRVAESFAVRPDDGDEPSRPQERVDLAKVAQPVGTEGESCAARDLDCQRFDSQVDAVATECALGDGYFSMIFQHSPERLFIGTAEEALALPRQSAASEFILGAHDATRCGVSSGGPRHPLLSVEAAHHHGLRLGTGTKSIAVGDELVANMGGRDTEYSSDLAGRETVSVGGPNSHDVQGLAMTMTDAPRNPFGAQHSEYRSFADVEGGRELYRALAGDVSTSDVVAVNLKPWAGHVYNLQTREGWYVANGIVTHNCMTRDGMEFDEAGMVAEREAEHVNGTLSFSPSGRAELAG